MEPVDRIIKRFSRVFLSAFLLSAGLFLEGFNRWDVIGKSFEVSIKDGLISSVDALIIPLVLSSGIAGLNSVGKYLRENKEKYRGVILKLLSDIF
jgi:hypothetical protein